MKIENKLNKHFLALFPTYAYICGPFLEKIRRF